MLGMRLAVMHNLYFYNTLLEKIRFAMDQGDFEGFYRQYREFGVKNLKICLRLRHFIDIIKLLIVEVLFYNVKF